MDKMHEAKKKGVLMVHHHFAYSHKNRGIHAKNRRVFIVLKMKKVSLCPNSHDHAKFSHDYAKLIRIAIEILCL